tara:strand:+ start:274 stop:480 length:207 start_codon:yes stop_codon:yes gene_type:complete
MKNTLSSFKNRIIHKYFSENNDLNESKSTNINVLLNRVKLDQKLESRKKILFTAVISVSAVLFGVFVF